MKDMLLPVGRLLDHPRLEFLNRLMSKTIQMIAPVILDQTTIKTNFSDQFKTHLFLRGSVASSVGFNPIFSDWDIGLVLEFGNATETEERIRRFISALQKARRMNPAIGEVEIYSHQEFSELQNLMKRSASIYQDLRCVRKLRWIEKANLTAEKQSKYQSFKSRRAREQCFTRLGLSAELADRPDYLKVAIKKVLENLSIQIAPRAPYEAIEQNVAPLYQAYLDLDLTSIDLEVADSVELFAILPPHHVPSTIETQVYARRQNHEIGKLAWTLTRIEELIVGAAMRGSLSPLAGYTEWIQILRETQARLES